MAKKILMLVGDFVEDYEVMVPFQALLAEVTNPFAPERGREVYALPAPTGFGRYVTYCGT